MSKGIRMYFNHPKAWERLSTRGHVTTLRAGKITKKDLRPVTVQIYRWGRFTGVKAKRILLNRIYFKEDYDAILQQWLFASGFDTVAEWKEAAIKMSGNKEVWKLYMIEVEEENPILFGMSEETAKRLWDNEDDEFWNDV